MKPKSENEKPQSERRERQDWLIVLLILLLGFVCVCVSAQYALRFAPSWKLNTNMESGIDPNSDFLTKPAGFVEPVDAGILTQPAWVKVFLTPGARVITGTPPPAQPTKSVPTQESTSVAPVTNTLPAVTLTNTVVPTNTFIWLPPPPGSTRPPKPPRTRVPPPDTAVPPSNTPLPSADLALANTDRAQYYVAGDTRTYRVTITNALGPSNVTGATFTDSFSGPISGVTWTCSAAGGAVCPAASGSGPITVLVDLPVGSTIRYLIVITADASGGNVVNSASIAPPASIGDPNLTNNALDDTDSQFVVPGPPPGGWGTAGTPPGTGCTPISVGAPITFSVPVPIVDGVAPDLIYYEELVTLPNPPFPPGTPGILMDKIIMEVSDGLNWVTVLNWDDNAPNNYTTNLVSAPAACGGETDNCPIDGATLINNAGIGIDIPDSLQNGPTTYIRVRALAAPPPDDGNICIDAFVAP